MSGPHYARQENFSRGMVRDVSSEDARADSVWDMLDMLTSKRPILRKRGGTLNLETGASVAGRVTELAYWLSGTRERRENLYGVGNFDINGGAGAPRTVTIYRIDRTTGVHTTINTWRAKFAGRPFMHDGALVFPFANDVLADTLGDCAVLGGSSVGVTSVAGAVQVNNQISDLLGFTGTPFGATPSNYVGAMIDCYNGAFTSVFTARIIEVLDNRQCRVWPAAANNILTFNLSVGSARPFAAMATGITIGAKHGLSYQGRVCLFNCYRNERIIAAYPSAFAWVQTFPGRMYYSSMNGERLSGQPAGGFGHEGYAQFDSWSSRRTTTSSSMCPRSWVPPRPARAG